MTLVLAAMLYWTWLQSLYPEKLSTDEVFTVTTSDLWKLRVCRYRRGRSLGEPILLVHGSGANHHNFTCPEGGSLIDYLVEKGYDCWAVDLRGCRSSQPPFGFHWTQAAMDDMLI